MTLRPAVGGQVPRRTQEYPSHVHQLAEGKIDDLEEKVSRLENIIIELKGE